MKKGCIFFEEPLPDKNSAKMREYPSETGGRVLIQCHKGGSSGQKSFESVAGLAGASVQVVGPKEVKIWSEKVIIPRRRNFDQKRGNQARWKSCTLQKKKGINGNLGSKVLLQDFVYETAGGEYRGENNIVRKTQSYTRLNQGYCRLETS